MLVFDFPKEIGDKRVDIYLALIKELDVKKGLKLRFSKHARLSPAAYAILACIIDRACELRVSISWDVPKALLKQYPYLAKLSLQSLTPGLLPDASIYQYDDPMQMFAVAESCLLFNFIENFSYRFKLSEDLFFDCKLILDELMLNACDHAGGERYYLYVGLWHNEIHLGVMDLGVSIPSKLQNKYACDNDRKYIELAMQEGITTRRQRVGGLGLAHFKDVLKNNAGKLTIISGGAQVRYYFKTRKSQKNLLKHRLPGTWCCARIPL